MIKWPCIFKLDGDPELMFIDSEPVLTRELESLIWSDSDRLIDSDGHNYMVVQHNKHYVFKQGDEVVSLAEITHLIQEHEFAKAEVCLTKIQFVSVEQAIQSLSMEQ